MFPIKQQVVLHLSWMTAMEISHSLGWNLKGLDKIQ